MKWFKHDTDANLDGKLQNVLLDYGLEGYGLYWYCIELIAGKVDKDNIKFELEHDARIIARNTGSTQQKVEEMMRSFIKLGLFENIDGRVTCLKLAARLDKSMTSNSEMRKLIDSLKNHDPVMTPSEDSHDKVMKEEIRIDKIKDLSDSQAKTDIDFSPVIHKWNEFAEKNNLQKIQGITRKRKAKVKTSYKSYRGYCKDFKREPLELNEWLEVMIDIAEYNITDFDRGDNPSGWTMSFDYLLTEKVVAKATENGVLR